MELKEIEDKELLFQAAIQMDKYSKEHCVNTPCTDKRMHDVENDCNCEWYHGAWMYCRMAKIVVTDDYFGEYYDTFFEQRRNSDRIDVLICGMADYALVAHVLRRIPSALIDKVYITLLDICNSPLLLCKWYIEKEFPQFLRCLTIVRADATDIPFPGNSFDLITSSSFLTRMVYSEAEKVVMEWKRLLKSGGEIFTSVHVYNNSNCEGEFYRSENADIEYAMKKLETCISEYSISDKYAEKMRQKVKKYLSNIMTVAMSESRLKDLFNELYYSPERYDQPGELELIHQMILVRAISVS